MKKKQNQEQQTIEDILMQNGWTFSPILTGFVPFMIVLNGHPAAPKLRILSITILNLMFNFPYLKK